MKMTRIQMIHSHIQHRICASLTRSRIACKQKSDRYNRVEMNAMNKKNQRRAETQKQQLENE